MTATQKLRVPAFVGSRTASWGGGGTNLAAYIAALVDRPDLERSAVLGVDGNTDMLLGIINQGWKLGSYAAVEPDLIIAAFFSSYVRHAGVDLVTSNLVDDREATLDAIGADRTFDVIVVRTAAHRMTQDRLDTMLDALRSVSTASTRMVIPLPLNRPTVSGTAAIDRILRHGIEDLPTDYGEVEWASGRVPLYSPERAVEIAANHGWRVDEICEPRRGFRQHHLVLSVAG